MKKRTVKKVAKEKTLYTLRDECINKIKKRELIILKKKANFLEDKTFAELINLAQYKYGFDINAIGHLKENDLRKLIFSINNYLLAN